jgi:DNA-directed RNA polymerase III subunit RPC1
LTLSQAIASRKERSLLPFEILEIVEHELTTKRFTCECDAAYLMAIRSFITGHVVHRLAAMRRSRGMFDALERQAEWDADTDLSLSASGTMSAVLPGRSTDGNY